jgi:antitoxin (DNA-binding transcriptional repressor) of toxin-antitoxin stability system
MHTLPADEVHQQPGQLLADAHRGETSLPTKDGTPVMLGVPLTPSTDTGAALIDLAATLYDTEQISLGRAAEVAGLSYVDMLDELGRRGIATLRLRPGDLERELAAFGP